MFPYIINAIFTGIYQERLVEERAIGSGQVEDAVSASSKTDTLLES